MYTFQADITGEHEADEETVHLEHGENLLELHIIGAKLSPSAMELLGECEPSTFCTYTFYKFEMHCTPLVMGDEPKYGFTSKYIINMDNDFLEYMHRRSITVELHQKLVGCNWRTVAASQLRLQQLLEHKGKVQGSVPLVGKLNMITGTAVYKSINGTFFLFMTYNISSATCLLFSMVFLHLCYQACPMRFLPLVPFITGSG